MANHGRILKSAMNGNKMENAERLTSQKKNLLNR
jgi:hypothetical protein